MKNIHNFNSWATTDATTNFDAAWKALSSAGLIASIDESLIWLLAERLSQYVSLRDEAEGKPTLVPLGSGSLAVNPIIKLRDEASKDVARLLRAVGMTPLSRRGLAKVRDAVRPGDDLGAKFPELHRRGGALPKWHPGYEATAEATPSKWSHLKPDASGRLPRHEGYDPETAI